MMNEILEVEKPLTDLASPRKGVTAYGTEICVCCGKDTGVPADQDIYLRFGYIKGCGQLCGHCAEIFS